MAVRHNSPQTAKETMSSKTESLNKANTETRKEMIDDHLPPLSLVLTVLLCSGALSVLAMRDFAATGKNILGSIDEPMLLFTKSTDWFEHAKGWKSTQGGFSAIQQITTDTNNMGGFFIRKLAGAASLAVHLQKIWPLLFHPKDAQWKRGHFSPMLWTSVVANLAIIAFYSVYWNDLVASNANQLPLGIIAALVVESLVIVYHLATVKKSRSTVAIAMPEGKTPNSVTSRIISRTVLMITTPMLVFFGRDLFAPGYILEFVPRDDVYLEWTNAFLHSPPEGSPEAMDQGLEAPLYVGDKFISQLAALHILVLCVYKLVASVFIRYGNDGGGLIAAKMIWKGQFIGDAMILFLFRLFTPAAASASLDLRWHLMCIAYETFLLGLYGFF